jgi:hypothetical protein
VSSQAKIPFQITDSKGNKLSNITFEILRKESLVHLKTNNSGLVFLNLNYVLLSENPNLRFVGDGLAELISFMILKTTNPDYAEIMLNNRLKSIEKSSQLEFDIYNWSIESEEIEGYSYSLAFWLKLLENYSIEQIQYFIRLFDNATEYSRENVHKMFETAFGLNITFNLTKSEAIDKLTNTKK